MARASKRKEVECANNASTGRKTRQKELRKKRLSRQEADETRERDKIRLLSSTDSLNQTKISHFFCPLEVDTKKVQITISAGTSRVTSSKGKVALRKCKPKKSKAKQLEEVSKYNK